MDELKKAGVPRAYFNVTLDTRFDAPIAGLCAQREVSASSLFPGPHHPAAVCVTSISESGWKLEHADINGSSQLFCCERAVQNSLVRSLSTLRVHLPNKTELKAIEIDVKAIAFTAG